MARLLLAILVLVTASAQAAPVLWTLTDVEFYDGGTATGSFIYDADLNVFSAINVTTSGGSIAGAVYADLLDGSANNAAVMPNAALVDLTGEPLFQFVFQTPLTNAGGFVDLTFINPALSSFEFSCSNAACTSGSIERIVSGGGLLGSPAPVPLPAPLLLFASALAVLTRVARGPIR
jgi:hypothetical protein